MDKYKITFNTWNKIADLYQEKFMDLQLYDDTYDLFCQQIPTRNAAILEIGCGPGNITKYLLNKRSDFAIYGIDVAPNMIELAQQNNPSAQFQVMDCRHLNQLAGKYDGIICGFCLPYLSKEDCTKLISDCSNLARSGCTLYLSAIAGDYSQSGYESGSSGDQAFVYYYRSGFLRAELEVHGFECLEVVEKSYPKREGGFQVHLILIAKLNDRESIQGGS